MTAVFVSDTAGEAAEAAADRLIVAIEKALRERGAAHIALAGGNTPRRTYELLATRIDAWSGVEVWFGDERAVGPDDPESNYRMASETLLARGGGPEVHRIEGERGAEEAAAAYTELMSERLPGADGVPVLDLALQGLGPDGHTASLFPGNPAVEAPGVCVAVHDAPKPPPDRITLTVPVLRAARSIVFLATGEDKAEAVRGLLAGPSPDVPASLLGGERTEVIVDRAAAPTTRSVTITRAVPNIKSDQPAETREFFVDLLGFEVAMDLDWVVTLASPTNRSAQVTIISNDDPAAPGISVEVADVDAVHARAVEQGFEIAYSLRDEEWGVRRFMLREPSGTLVNVVSHRLD